MPRKRKKNKSSLNVDKIEMPKIIPEPSLPNLDFSKMSNITVRKFIYSNCLAIFITNRIRKPLRHSSRTELINALYKMKQEN